MSLLREIRRGPDDPEEIVLSSADPLNLTGIVLPGKRVAPQVDISIVFRNGVPVDRGPHGALLARRQRRAPAATAR